MCKADKTYKNKKSTLRKALPKPPKPPSWTLDVGGIGVSRKAASGHYDSDRHLKCRAAVNREGKPGTGNAR